MQMKSLSESIAILLVAALWTASVHSETRYPSSVSGGIRTFDGMVIHLQKDSIDDAERKHVKEMLRKFACGVYEATEGKHRIGTVKIKRTSDDIASGELPGVVWTASGPSRANAEAAVRLYSTDDGTVAIEHAGIGGGGPINMAHVNQGTDMFSGGEYSSSKGGGTLAHEWGHAVYGFFDEYVETTYDKYLKKAYSSASVSSTLMNGSNRYNGNGTITWYGWNYSIPFGNPGTRYKDAIGTGQHNYWGKSCWEVLAQNDQDCFSDFLKSGGTSLRSDFYPQTQLPDEESAATAVFKVVWLDAPLYGICVDCSGSMAGDRIKSAIDVVKAKIATEIPDGAWVEVAGFESESHILVPFTEIDDSKDGGMSRMNVIAQIDKLTAGGGTAIWDALDQMITDIEEKKKSFGDDNDHPAFIWFVTDGEDFESRHTREAVQARANAKTNKIKICSVGFGDGTNNEELKRIANNTDGKFQQSGDSNIDLLETSSRDKTTDPSRVSLIDTRSIIGSTGRDSHRFWVDSSIRVLTVSLAVKGAGTGAIVELVDPATGKTIRPIVSTLSGGNGVVSFRIARPSTGTWTLKVSSAKSGATVAVQAQGTPSIDTPRLTVRVRGTNLVAFLTQGAPVDGANVVVTANNGSSRKTKAMAGRGYGLYTIPKADLGNIDGGVVVTATATAGVAILRNDSPTVSHSEARSATMLAESFVRSAFLDISQRVESTVTFDPRGGTVKPKSKSYKIHESFNYSFPIPVRKGYAFNGWYRQHSYGSSSWEEMLGMGSGSAPNDDITVFAKWSSSKSKIGKTFYAEGGKLPKEYFRITRRSYNVTKDLEIGIKSFTIGKKFGSLPKPTRKGYSFAGWYSSETGGTKITAKTIVPDTYALLSLHAHWKAKKVKVSFKANGGKTKTKKKTYTFDSKYGTLPTATRSGYKFAGWYTKKQGGTRIFASSKATLAKTFYAHWVKNSYVVKFYPNGGKLKKKSKRVSYGMAMGALPTPTRKGYAFLGWFTAKKGGKQISSASKAGGDKKLWAHWDKGYTVTLVYNDGTGRKKKVVFPGKTFGGFDMFKLVSPPSVSRSGYTFKGWYLKKNSTSNSDLLFLDGNYSYYSAFALYFWDFNWPEKRKKGSFYGEKVRAVTVYATWEKDASAAQTSSSSSYSGKRLLGKKLVSLPKESGKASAPQRDDPVLNEYVFAGWAVSREDANKGIVAYDSTCSEKVLRAAMETGELYAVWAKKSYKVAFLANGGTGEMPAQTMAYGNAKNLAANSFKAPKGLTFAGWATSKAKAKKGEVKYKDKAKVKNLLTNGKTVKLYAVWKRK